MVLYVKADLLSLYTVCKMKKLTNFDINLSHYFGIKSIYPTYARLKTAIDNISTAADKHYEELANPEEICCRMH